MTTNQTIILPFKQNHTPNLPSKTNRPAKPGGPNNLRLAAIYVRIGNRKRVPLSS